jgi:hypothetical protein
MVPSTNLNLHQVGLSKDVPEESDVSLLDPSRRCSLIVTPLMTGILHPVVQASRDELGFAAEVRDAANPTVTVAGSQMWSQMFLVDRGLPRGIAGNLSVR